VNADPTQLACALEIEGRITEAAHLYRQAIALLPNAGIANANLGYLMLIHGNAAGAYECLERALTTTVISANSPPVVPTFSPDSLPGPAGNTDDKHASSACLLLGLKLQESGRFAEARSCFAHSIRLNRCNGSAYHALSQANKVTGRDLEFVRLMEDALKEHSLGYADRSSLHFALGKAMDDLEQYEGAMAHFDEANRLALLLPGAKFSREGFKADIDSVIATYTKKAISEKRELDSKSELPLLIVGMMRSGTTLVEQIVSSHADVTAGEEQVFWRDHGYRYLRAGASLPTAGEAKLLAEAYEGCLREIGGKSLRVTDKMPQNFMAAGLVHLLFPEVRSVCCRRNPVDTCLSIYMTQFRHGLPFTNSREDIVFFYRQFDRLVSHWRNVIPPDRFTELSYEALLTDRELTTRNLIEYCGLSWDQACLHPEDNQRAVRTASMWQVRQPVYATSMDRWRRYEPWLGAFAELIPP